MHHQRHKGHHAHHHGGQAIDKKAHFHLEAADHHPGVEGLVKVGTIQRHRFERGSRQHKSNQNTQNGQGVTQFAADPVATKAGAENTSQCCARQWGQRYSQQRRCGKGLTHCV